MLLWWQIREELSGRSSFVFRKVLRNVVTRQKIAVEGEELDLALFLIYNIPGLMQINF